MRLRKELYSESMSKELIIGSNGQLAFDLIRVLKNNHEVIEVTHQDVDVCDCTGVGQLIGKYKPDTVINTAAYHKVEDCETNPEKSFQVNAIGAFNVAQAAAAVGARSVFISTDYVFDGGKETFFEDDIPNPLNVYGASKLAGEILTRIGNPAYYIVRTSWLFGIHQSGKGHNFVSLMLEKARSGEPVKVVDDQFGSPTYTYDLARKIKEFIDRNAPSGIYHITNSGFCSWYEFAREIFNLSGIKVDIVPVSSSEFSSRVRRPQYSVLLSKNLDKVGIGQLRDWQIALTHYLKEKGQYPQQDKYGIS